MFTAEDFCVNLGGHLASVGSNKEQMAINKLRLQEKVLIRGRLLSMPAAFLLGGIKVAGEQSWKWLDGREWVHNGWPGGKQPKERSNVTCVITLFGWNPVECNQEHFFLCQSPPKVMSGSHTFVLTKEHLLDPVFHFWWNHTAGKKESEQPGIELS